MRFCLLGRRRSRHWLRRTPTSNSTMFNQLGCLVYSDSTGMRKLACSDAILGFVWGT
jgi:hypothetical protein